MKPPNDFKSLIARKIIDVVRKQKPNDIQELRRLAAIARQHGSMETADHADEIAKAFEEEDGK